MNNFTETDRIESEEILCPIRYSLDVVGGKWKLPILCALSSGDPSRYSAIKRKLGHVTNMMLSQSLKELESTGMVSRQQYNEVPPRVEYALTEKGHSIVPVLGHLSDWGKKSLRAYHDSNIKCAECKSEL